MSDPKRQRTEGPGTGQHVRFTEDGEAVEVTEDDKKALPQDLEIPLRFQVYIFTIVPDMAL